MNIILNKRELGLLLLETHFKRRYYVSESLFDVFSKAYFRNHVM